MKIEMNTMVALAIASAVRQTIAVIGINGLRRTSLFPSSKAIESYKLAA